MTGPRTVLVVNVRARRGEEWFERARAGLAERGVELFGAYAVDPAELPERVREELARGAERIVVGGGDGSLAAAARVLAGTGAALGVLPLGTANDFARSLHIPDDLEGALRVVARGAERAVDVAWLGDSGVPERGEPRRLVRAHAPAARRPEAARREARLPRGGAGRGRRPAGIQASDRAGRARARG